MLSPPMSRKPVVVNIAKYSFSYIKKAVHFELLREGRVFIVDSSVEKVLFLYKKLKVAFSGFKVAFLYGSLDKKEIRRTMGSFRSGKIDILISTTIIGSGIDVPSANSVLILNSHLFGLSQLYQIKGRVGRGVSQGYAYFLYPSLDKITQNGKKRL